MINKVKDTIEKFDMVKRGDTIIVGVSGGADSVCLTDVLNSLKEELELNIILVHINHNIRGEEADRDEAFVLSLGERYGNKVKVFSYNVAKLAKESGQSIEEMGRELRYKAFLEVAEDKAKIAVAHNINDNCETMIMRFFRGSGVKGLSGISPVRDNIIRPLIEVERWEIEKYCTMNGLEYCKDSTNEIDIYTRNKIRNKLIPYIEREFNPSIVKCLYRTSEIMHSEEVYLNELAELAYIDCEISPKRIAVDRLNTYDKVIQRRIIRLGVSELSINLYNVSYDHIESVLSLINKPSGKIIELPNNIRAVRESNVIHLYIEKDIKNFEYDIALNEVQYYNELGANILLSTYKIEDNDKIICTIDFDYDKIKTDIVLRSRKAGDKIFIKGIGGSKSIKDLFIEQKIPMIIRNSIPILATKDGSVLWVMDLKTSDEFKATDSSANLLHLYILEA